MEVFFFLNSNYFITVIQVYALTSNTEEAEVERFYEDLQDLLELTPKKHILFIIRDWNANVGSQETPGVIGKFGLGVENEAGAQAQLPRNMWNLPRPGIEPMHSVFQGQICLLFQVFIDFLLLHSSPL